jgi:transcription-repair coupling factor (superfamily II helicase)
MVGPNSIEHWILESHELPPTNRWVVGDDLSKALSLVALAQKTADPILVVCGTRTEARNLLDNYSFLMRGQRNAHYLPSIEFDYHRGLLPNPEVLCERNVALYHALHSKGVVISTLPAILQKAVPAEMFKEATSVLTPNSEVDREAFIDKLIRCGYQRQPTAYDPGIFSVRGAVLDIFCPLYPKPVRLEFYGDLIDEIRFFDPKTQLSKEKLESIAVIPVGLSLIPEREKLGDVFSQIRNRLDHLEVLKIKRDEILENIRSGAFQPEYSFLFPYLSIGSNPVFDYFPSQTKIIWDGREKIEGLAEDPELLKLQKSHEHYEQEPFPIAEYKSLFFDLAELKAQMGKESTVFWEAFSSGKDEIALSSQEALLMPAEGAGKNPSALIPRNFEIGWIKGIASI